MIEVEGQFDRKDIGDRRGFGLEVVVLIKYYI